MRNPGNPFVLPTHPTMRHPHTGDRLRAVGIVDGRPVWPIMGASPDDDPPAGGAGGDGGDGGKGGDGDGSGGDDGKGGKPSAGNDGGGAGGDGGADKGFPENTPIVEMTPEQQSAYWRHQARKHEDRNRGLLQVTGGKTAEEIKAEFEELEKLRDQSRTDGERAVEEAKRTTRTETVKVVGTAAARTVLEFALGHDPEENDQSTLIDSLDLTKVLAEDGTVDAAKVRDLASKIAPSDKGQGNQRHDYGGGRRGGNAASGVSAGRSRYRDRHGKSDKD